jgi:hypothetical protein
MPFSRRSSADSFGVSLPPRAARSRTEACVECHTGRRRETAEESGSYVRLVCMTLLRTRTLAAIHGVISEATRNGGPEFQGVARNQPTRGSVPRITAEACRFDRVAEKSAAAPSRTKAPSPIETPRS